MIPQNDIRAVDAAIEEASDRAIEEHYGSDFEDDDHGERSVQSCDDYDHYFDR